jgi:hypothetical protein|tara:strand:- start:2839 stop:4461 length:1623 start_codon:yes stop_codon:yes gene_type:complete
MLNEQVNKRVVYEDDKYELILPYNISSICSIAPQWCEDEKIKDATVNAFKSGGVTYILLQKDTNKVGIVQDTKSKIPLRLSGEYAIFDPLEEPTLNINFYRKNETKKFFSDKPGLIEKLNIPYSLKERLKFEMPFTGEEMKQFSEKSNFAKTVYDQIEGKNIPFETWEKFEGRDDVDVIKSSWYADSMASGALAIMPDDNGITIFAEESYFKEKFLNLTDDDDWAYNAAMNNGGYYNDCEEMEHEEMNYINNYLTPENRERLQDLRGLVGQPKFTEQELYNDEGNVYDFLEKYFPIEADDMADDWLNSLGCAIWRGRAKAIREEIDDAKIFDYDERGRTTEMFLTWKQLLQVIGTKNIENFYDLGEIELNELPQLYDGWYDTWDVDDEGTDDMNGDFKRMLDKIEKEGAENIIERVKRLEAFTKKIMELGFKKATGWNSGFSNRTPVYNWKTSDGKSTVLTDITIGNYTPETETISVQDKSENSTNKNRMDDIKLDNFIEYASNPRLPFNQEEKEEVNENYTNKIINTIINNIITKNVRK